MFALYAAPGVNLFEKTLDRIPVKSNQYEFPVIPDRSRLLDFETNRVMRVFAHIPGAPQKVAGRAALFGEGGAQRDRPLLHDPPPAAPAHGRREEIRTGFRLHRHRRLSVARRALRPERSCCASPSSASKRSAPTGISPSICRSARAAPISASSTTSSSTCAASPARRRRASRR